MVVGREMAGFGGRWDLAADEQKVAEFLLKRTSYQYELAVFGGNTVGGKFKFCISSRKKTKDKYGSGSLWVAAGVCR